LQRYARITGDFEAAKRHLEYLSPTGDRQYSPENYLKAVELVAKMQAAYNAVGALKAQGFEGAQEFECRF
jgi:hypothetical protein